MRRMRWVATTVLVLCLMAPSAAIASTAQYYMNPNFPTNKNVAALAIGVNKIGTTSVPLFNTTYGRQCVEYVNRYYYYGMGYNTTAGGLSKANSWTGNGADYYGSYAAKRLSRYANKGTTAPRAGDILCFSGGYKGFGHVAIVVSVGSNYVKVIEQNYASKASIRNITMTVSGGKYTVANSASSTPCQGWLRAKYAAPTLGNVARAGDAGLKLSWTAVTGANGYEIYRSTSAAGTYKSIKSVTGTSFTDSGLTGGTTYFYKVRPYRLVGTVKVYGAYSSVKSALVLAAVKNARTEFALVGIGVRWDAVAGATGYEVYRSTSETGTFTRIAFLTGQASVALDDRDVAWGTTYYYKVRAYKTVGAANLYGPFSGVASGQLF